MQRLLAPRLFNALPTLPPSHTLSLSAAQLKDTIEYQKKSRKCYCCMIVVLIIVILAVTIGVGSFFGVKQNSRLRV